MKQNFTALRIIYKHSTAAQLYTDPVMSGGRACHARFPRAVLTQSILAEPADPNIDPGLTWDLGPGIMDCVSVRNRGAEPSDPPHYADKEQLASWLTSTRLCAACCCWTGSFARVFLSLLTGKFKRQC